MEQWDFEASESEFILTEVDALNSDGVPIVSGNADVYVSPGETTTAQITLGRVTGHGAVLVEFRWPSGLLVNSLLAVTLSYYSA